MNEDDNKGLIMKHKDELKKTEKLQEGVCPVVKKMRTKVNQCQHMLLKRF